jgi:predicted RNA polymerase sigma factor
MQGRNAGADGKFRSFLALEIGVSPVCPRFIASGKQGELANYYLAHSARADMYRRLGRRAEARSAYEKALALTQQEPERQFLAKRLEELK